MQFDALLDLVTHGGAVLAPVFCYLWWDERGERREIQSKYELLSEKTLTNVSDFKNLLQTVVDIFNGRKT
jgi:hypothetical protein